MRNIFQDLLILCCILTVILVGILFVVSQTDTTVIIIEHKFTRDIMGTTEHYFTDKKNNVYCLVQDVYTHGDKWTKELKYDTYPHIRYGKIVEGRIYKITYYKYSTLYRKSLNEEMILFNETEIITPKPEEITKGWENE